jgi:hypothetical protein
MAGHSRHRERLAPDVSRFSKEYARKAQRHQEPNDRHYDRKMELRIKRMDPFELSELLYDDGSGDIADE